MTELVESAVHIGPRLTEIVGRVQGYHPEADTDLINKAFFYSAEQHDGQMRKSGDCYFSHPASVANIIAEMRLDAASVCAALLHDVVEDTDVSNEDIESAFGPEVAFLVDGVTKLGRINFTCKEDQQAESFRKLIVAMARDIRVLLVKLADRLDNMRTLEHMKPDSQERIARETLEIYAPLAGRLGINWLKAELQDLSFKYLYPDAYDDLSRLVKKRARDSSRYIKDVCQRLSSMLIERGFAAEVEGRQKNLYSTWRKMRQNNVAFEQIHDVVAFRCLVESVSDCYASLGVVHSQWTPVPGRFKDYIALPKANMYQSLHTTVFGPGQKRIEVQIRTREMHRTAENGVAAHWQYKQRTGGLDKKDAERFAWLRQLMEFQREVQDPAEFLESVRVDLFPEEVYVFTPDGDVKTFPRGATPVDFAYEIHSEVGHRCTGAKVNGVMVPLRTRLRNGDMIEIITSKNQKPNKDWLEFVATGRARSRIRAYLRQEERARSITLGRDLFERAMRKKSLSFSRLLKSDQQVKKLLARFKCKNQDELFAEVGFGKISTTQLIDFIAPEEDNQARESLKPGFIERTVNRVKQTAKSDDAVIVAGMGDVLVRFGRCCNPVPGDPVTGWITRGRGVTVHRRGCNRVMELPPERRLEVTWAASQERYPVSLTMVTTDRQGILAEISRTFTERSINITEANCRTLKNGNAINVFQFSVDDLDHLKVLMRKLRMIEGVQDVERG